MPNRAEEATQRVWTIWAKATEGSTDDIRVGTIRGPKADGVEVLPTSLLEELAEWCEERAEHRRRSAKRWRRNEMPLARAEQKGQSTAFAAVAAKLRSLLSQEEPDGNR